jgi:hypothetical protein
MKFSYLHDGDPDDIAMVERSIDVKKKKIDVPQIMKYGGARFYRDLTAVHESAR